MRNNIAAQCIASAMCLTRMFRDDETTENVIFNRTHDILLQMWNMEYKSYGCDNPAHVALLSKAFWNSVNLELTSEHFKCTVYCDQTVNPPGTEGRVLIQLQPSGSFKVRVITLDINPNLQECQTAP